MKLFKSDGDVKVSSRAADETKPSFGGVKRTFADVAEEDRALLGGGLFHYVHTRVIVEEIYIPMTMITSGRQLVRAVYDAVVGQ